MIRKMMDEGSEQSLKVFQYVSQRVRQTFLETWFAIFMQTASLGVPLLLIVCYMHRVISFASLRQADLLYDFKPIIERIKEHEGTGARYDALQDRDNFQVIVSEVLSKGLVPVEYQLDFINFAILWYYFATFTMQTFALLYYRKYRES